MIKNKHHYKKIVSTLMKTRKNIIVFIVMVVKSNLVQALINLSQTSSYFLRDIFKITD